MEMPKMLAVDSDRSCIYVQVAALILIVLAILGPVLPGVEVSVGNLFPYRIALIPNFCLYTIYVLQHQQFRIAVTTSGIAFAAFVLLLLAATLNSLVTGGPITSLLLLGTNLALLLVIAIGLTNRVGVYRGWLVLTGLAIVAMSVATVEFLTGWHVPYSQLQTFPNRPPYTGWFTAWFRNVNNLAYLLHFGTILPLVLALRPSKDYLFRILCGLLWVTNIAIAVHLDARVMIITAGITAVVAIGLIRSPRFRLAAKHLPVRIGLVSVPLIGVILAFIFVYWPNPFSMPESSLWIRWQLQKAAVVSSGLFGNGFTRTSWAISQSGVETTMIFSPHSWFGSILGSTGLVGLTCFLAFYGGTVAQLVRVSQEMDSVRTTSAISLITLPFASLGPSNALQTAVFWVVLGLCIATVNTGVLRNART
jgi:hypothetical protein